MALESVLGGLALDQSVQDVKSLADQINTLNDTMLYFATAILRSMPRKDTADRQAVLLDQVSGGVGMDNVQRVFSYGGLNNSAAYASNMIPFNQSNMGALHIYNNIQVTA